MAASERTPRVLVTGFSSFPGVADNPTERLIEALAARARGLADVASLRLETLPVDYRGLPARLRALGAWEPEISLHFGVSAKADRFMLETLARNRICRIKSDAAGYRPADDYVVRGGSLLESSLPVQQLFAELAARGLPVGLSDDAGDYLCNTLFYLSRGSHCPPFRPTLSGFIHVPPFGAQTDAGVFSLDTLVLGAEVVIRTCCAAWRRDHAGKKKAAPVGAAS